jgi:hypothetical protein
VARRDLLDKMALAFGHENCGAARPLAQICTSFVTQEQNQPDLLRR